MTTIRDWNIQALTGYVPKTTFYRDFSIADRFGESAIKDTFSRCFKSWKNNVEYLTELAMAMNWKMWEHYDTNPAYGRLYQSLWEKVDGYATENLKGEDLTYYFRTTD